MPYLFALLVTFLVTPAYAFRAPALQADAEYISRGAAGFEAGVEIIIHHQRPLALVYGILMPTAGKPPREKLGFVVEIYGPDGKQYYPLSSTTCTVGQKWEGRCEKVFFEKSGPSRIFIFYPLPTLELMRKVKIEKSLVLLSSEALGLGRTFEIELEKLLKMASGQSF